jgi:UDP-2-acetamido-3-amino-2,3-dideoxy-glucuronate N-acetyltransferase
LELPHDEASARVGIVIHPTAEVSDEARIGEGTRIWHQAQVREGATIGAHCILGKGVYVDFGVRIGNHCKLQNAVSVFHGFDLEDGVFLGPGVMLLNDKQPRAINTDGSLKTDADWTASRGTICEGASVGGGAVVLPGVRVGRYALVGAGAVVTRDVPDHGIVYGNPARLHGFACVCGGRLDAQGARGLGGSLTCAACGRTLRVPAESLRLLEQA